MGEMGNGSSALGVLFSLTADTLSTLMARETHPDGF